MARRETFSTKEFAPYALGIGQATLAWNDLHQHLALMFHTILGEPPHNVGYALWHSSNQDRASRKMLKSVLYEIPLRWIKGYPTATEDVEWLLKRIDDLEDVRNDIIHAPLFMVGRKIKTKPDLVAAMLADAMIKPRVLPLSILGNKRAAKLQGKDLLAEFRYCRNTALSLRNYIAQMNEALKDRSSWPTRPKLPARPSGAH